MSKTDTFTLAEARGPLKDWAGRMHLTDLDMTDAELGTITRRWLYLLDFDAAGASPELRAAANEDLMEDGSLIVALSGSANSWPDSFRQWWKRDDWGIYCLTEVTGSEDWAIDLLKRIPDEWPTALTVC
jgi:hypothetical protein